MKVSAYLTAISLFFLIGCGQGNSSKSVEPTATPAIKSETPETKSVVVEKISGFG